MRKWSAAALFSVISAGSPIDAWALDPYVDLGLTTEYVCFKDEQRYHGVGIGVDGIYAFNDYFAVRGRYVHGEHRGRAVLRVDRVSVAGRLQLDVAHVVPWLEFAATGYLTSGELGPANGLVGVAAGMGLDWLLDGGLSFGIGAHLHTLGAGDEAATYSDMGFRLGYRFVFGDPFDP